jgi:hypothetical protein
MKRFLVALAILSPLAQPVAAQKSGGTLTSVLHSDPTGLVLAFPSNGPAQLVASKIYEGLVSYSRDLKPQPSLARSWTVSPDGREVEVQFGDLLISAILLHQAALRRFEFGDGYRAGFCLMAACQDCWVKLGDGRRVRACDTVVRPGMSVTTGVIAINGSASV